MRYTILTLAASAATALAQPQRPEQGKSQCERALFSPSFSSIDAAEQICDALLLGDTIGGLPLDPMHRKIILDGCNQSEEEVKSTCQKAFPETLRQPQQPGQGKSQCESALFFGNFNSIDAVEQFCDAVVLSGQTVGEMPLDLVQRRIILDRCNQSDEEVKSTCQKVFPETQGARRAIAQATPDCEKSISEFMLGKFAHVARFCRNMVNNGQTLESMLLPQLARQDILKDCNNSEEELKATCQKIITDPNSAKPSEACNDEMESLLGFEPSLAREGQYLAPDFCADVLRGMSFNEITSKKGIIQPTINEILGACQESEDILKSTCRKYQPEPPAPKPPAALEASEKCETEINDQFKPLPGVAGEHDQFNFCRDIVGGKSLENFGKERYLSSSTLTSIRDACEPSEEVIKLTCEKLLHFEASEKCNTEINEQFKRVPGISREDDYIPSDFCREIMGGKSLENIGKEKYFNPLTLASIRDACEPSEEVIKLTCEKLPRFEPEPDSNPDSPTPSDTKFELNQSASSNNQPGANADPVIPTLPSTCQLDSKPCEWSECRPFDNGSSRYDPKTGKEVVYKEKNAEGVPEGECKGRFGPACADGLSRQLVCGKRSTPDCQRNKRECYWVGQGPICPTFFLGDGQKDVHGRSFITGLDKKGGYTRMNPLADCREKAGARCEEGWKQLWCA